LDYEKAAALDGSDKRKSVKPGSPVKAPRVCSVLLVFTAVLAGAGDSRNGSGPKPGEPWENSLGMKFVPAPGANVLFCIWETRVQDFEAFVKATSYNAGEGWRAPGVASRGFNIDQDAVFSQTPLHPVTSVSWNDAVAFCRWLTEKERAEGKLSAGQEFRLPTDAEWSQAVGLPAESGATPEDKDRKIENVYPWGGGYPPPKGSGNYSGEGDGWSGAINGYADGAKFTAKVGSYTVNRLGIYDLGGNVWEWCSDWYNAEREARAIRGASFNQGAIGRLVSSYRAPKPPGVRDFNLGFRCVVTVGASARADLQGPGQGSSVASITSTGPSLVSRKAVMSRTWSARERPGAASVRASASSGAIARPSFRAATAKKASGPALPANTHS